MSTVYTSGTWQPNTGSEEAFIEAWSQFAEWASSRPGAGTLRLVRDLANPGRYQSFGEWDTIDAVREWKGSPEFRERMSRVLQHVDDFVPSEFELVASADAGATTKHTAGAIT